MGVREEVFLDKDPQLAPSVCTSKHTDDRKRKNGVGGSWENIVLHDMCDAPKRENHRIKYFRERERAAASLSFDSTTEE